jgi:hypothetical protein
MLQVFRHCYLDAMSTDLPRVLFILFEQCLLASAFRIVEYPSQLHVTLHDDHSIVPRAITVQQSPVVHSRWT